MADTLSLLALKNDSGKVCLAEDYDRERKEASIVAKANGQKAFAEQIFDDENGCAQALFVLQPRYLYLKGHLQSNKKPFIRIYRIIRFRVQNGVPIVEVRMFNRLSRGRWLIPLFDWLNPVVDALKEKLLDPENTKAYARSPEEEKRCKKKKKAHKKPPVK